MALWKGCCVLVLILFCEQITVMVSNKAPCVKFCTHFILFCPKVELSRANDAKSLIRMFSSCGFQNIADNAVHWMPVIKILSDSDHVVVSISFLEQLLIKFALV